MKKALITGITGQDGSILTRLLLKQDVEVHGIIRRSSTFNTSRIDDLMEDESLYNRKLFLHHGDLTDSSNLGSLISTIKPDVVYNLGAQSHVKVSFEVPEYTADVDGVGVLRLLDAIIKHSPDTRFYQASTSEMFGGVSNMPISGYAESTPFHPRSPYGVAKLYGYWITKNYREAYNLFGSNGILFNHESYYRGETFVTRKITKWCAKFLNDRSIKPLQLGNLNAFRDWGHAEDFCKAMIMIMDHDKPDDWVVATGETHTVKEFVNKCFEFMNIGRLQWNGDGVNERAWLDGELVVKVNEKFFRPSEVDVLLGDSTKIRSVLGWKPEYDFNSLVSNMMSMELKYHNKI
jgi:GDPmannose 4,6-dehydratase